MFFLPFLGLLSSKKNYLLNIILTSIIISIIYFFIYKDLHRLFYYYVGSGIHFDSKGSIFRTTFSLISVVIYFFYFKKFNLLINKRERITYLFFSILLIFSFILSFHFSTFADRMIIYIFPFQLFVFSNLSFIFHKNYRTIINFFILLLFNIYLILWLFLGTWSFVWIPYRNVVFEYIFNFYELQFYIDVMKEQALYLLHINSDFNKSSDLYQELSELSKNVKFSQYQLEEIYNAEVYQKKLK